MATIIDDFERGNLDPYTIYQVTQATTVNSPVFSGSLSCKITNDGDGESSIVSMPGDGLNYYPQRGDIFSAFSRVTTDNMNLDIGFAWQNNTSFFASNATGYRLRARNVQEDFFLQKVVNGSVEKSVSDTYELPEDEWVEVEFVFGSGGQFSDFVFEDGREVEVGSAGEHDYEFVKGRSLIDEGKSDQTFVSGTGIGGGAGDTMIARMFDGAANKIAEVELNDEEFDTGGIVLLASNYNANDETVYFDNIRKK